MDYRNAIKWYQYDPTKWFIYCCRLLHLATNLRVFPENEIKKGELSMQLKRLKKAQDGINWPSTPEQLPIVNWETCMSFDMQLFKIEINMYYVGCSPERKSDKTAHCHIRICS
jgi:hypothetical protein